ncbi:MAG: hypothetical protein K2M93_09970 [Muribaculaceae bacterium]|nr:hypothetical protein [Muribaculaceae bacterium]
MKKLLLLFSFIVMPLLVFAESTKPSYGVKIERNVEYAIIEGKTYFNVLVELDAADFAELFKDGVKVTVRDAENPKKKIYKKRFSKSFLYGFPSGQIQVGKGDILTQLVINKADSGYWRMMIKEKGIY